MNKEIVEYLARLSIEASIAAVEAAFAAKEIPLNDQQRSEVLKAVREAIKNTPFPDSPQ